MHIHYILVKYGETIEIDQFQFQRLAFMSSESSYFQRTAVGRNIQLPLQTASSWSVEEKVEFGRCGLVYKAETEIPTCTQSVLYHAYVLPSISSTISWLLEVRTTTDSKLSIRESTRLEIQTSHREPSIEGCCRGQSESNCDRGQNSLSTMVLIRLVLSLLRICCSLRDERGAFGSRLQSMEINSDLDLTITVHSSAR